MPLRTDRAASPSRVLFVSDVHLAPHLPGLIAAFGRFLESAAESASALYVLGDLFDFWVGPKNARIREFAPLFDGFRAAKRAGLAMTFVPGNRDFQLDPSFGRTVGLDVVNDFHEIALDGRRTLLHHGDLFCTLDRGYRRLRRVIRHPIVRATARTLPLVATSTLARYIRMRSGRAIAKKTSAERGIVDEAVAEWFRRGIETVVCGHVHGAVTREIVLEGSGGRGTLVTLGSFDEDGQFAAYAGGEFEHERFVLESA